MNEKIDGVLTKWAEKTTFSKDELVVLHKEIFDNEQKTYPEESAEEAEKHALAILKCRLKKEFLSNTVWKKLWFVTTGQFSDFTGSRHRKAKEEFANEPERAVNAGITDENGIPLYPVSDQWRGGQPMPEHDYQRAVYACNAEEGKFTIFLKGDAAKDFDFNLVGKLVNIPVWVNTNKSNEEMIVCSFNKRLQAIRVVESTESDGEMLKPQAFFPKCSSKKDFEAKVGTYEPVFIKGLVVEVNELQKAGSNNIVKIDPEFEDIGLEEGITCWVDSAIPLDFAEDSEVILLGTPGKGTNQQNQPTLSMNVFAIFDTPRTIKEKPQKIEEPKDKKSKDDDGTWF